VEASVTLQATGDPISLSEAGDVPKYEADTGGVRGRSEWRIRATLHAAAHGVVAVGIKQHVVHWHCVSDAVGGGFRGGRVSQFALGTVGGGEVIDCAEARRWVEAVGHGGNRT